MIPLACLSSACGPATGPNPSVPDLAGWTQSLELTTCSQWTSAMDEATRLEIARHALATYRRAADPASSAGDEMASTFASAISSACNDLWDRFAQLGMSAPIQAAFAAAFHNNSGFRP
jgi:hypothetical protein